MRCGSRNRPPLIASCSCRGSALALGCWLRGGVKAAFGSVVAVAGKLFGNHQGLVVRGLAAAAGGGDVRGFVGIVIAVVVGGKGLGSTAAVGIIVAGGVRSIFVGDAPCLTPHQHRHR